MPELMLSYNNFDAAVTLQSGTVGCGSAPESRAGLIFQLWESFRGGGEVLVTFPKEKCARETAGTVNPK